MSKLHASDCVVFSKFLFGGEGLQPGSSEVRAWLLVAVDCFWNVMEHVQKPDFLFRRNGRVHLSRQGASVQSTAGSRGVRTSGSNARYTMFRGSVKGTGYPLYSPLSPSLTCVTVCHHVSTGLYHPLSCYTSVDIVRRPLSGRQRNLGSIAVRGKSFFSYLKCVNRLWWSRSLVLIVYWG